MYCVCVQYINNELVFGGLKTVASEEEVLLLITVCTANKVLVDTEIRMNEVGGHNPVIMNLESNRVLGGTLPNY